MGTSIKLQPAYYKHSAPVLLGSIRCQLGSATVSSLLAPEDPRFLLTLVIEVEFLYDQLKTGREVDLVAQDISEYIQQCGTQQLKSDFPEVDAYGPVEVSVTPME
jgi:hypothetical protein